MLASSATSLASTSARSHGAAVLPRRTGAVAGASAGSRCGAVRAPLSSLRRISSRPSVRPLRAVGDSAEGSSEPEKIIDSLKLVRFWEGERVS